MTADLRPTLLPSGARIAPHPNLDMDMIRTFFEVPHAFVSMCKIKQENEGVDYLTPTPVQMDYIDAYHRHRWVMVNKYRQAKMTTIAVLLMLRDCMYLEGVTGLLVAEKERTVWDVFERITFAYENLPIEVRAPLKEGRKVGVEQLMFHHGGNIKAITMGGDSAAVGRSVDRLVVTEFGELKDQREAATSMIPTVSKRPNARVTIESTPGKAGSHHEIMWRASHNKQGRFHALFLEWWRDRTCSINPAGFTFTQAELDLLEKHPGMGLGNLAFRQRALQTEFAFDERLFNSKYPPNPLAGWLGSNNPIIPHDVLSGFYAESKPDPAEPNEHGCIVLEPPRKKGLYLITADPAGLGEDGDNSACTVWDIRRKRDVAFWEGREDPEIFALRLRRVQAYYNNAHLAVESNAAGCIVALRMLKTANLYCNNRHHPGWYASPVRKTEAEVRLVKLLRTMELELRSRGLILQLMDYDGSDRKKRRKNKDGSTSHFDRAITAVIAADLFSRRALIEMRVKAEMEDEDEDEDEDIAAQEEGQMPRGLRVSDYDRWMNRNRHSDVATNLYKKPPTEWM